METIEIQNDSARLVVIPAMGAGIAAYEALRQDGLSVPLLRRWKPSSDADPFALACNLLVPWSNRISGGGFVYQEQFHPLAPNFPGQNHPLHGNGFQVPWNVLQSSATSVTLELRDAVVGPFRYAASVRYETRGTSLEMELTVENQASEVLPYGMGFHPWFPRHPGTRLRAPAATVWHEDAEHLPTHAQLVSDVPEWDFIKSKSLPRGWINNGFAGWNRTAEIIQPEDGLRCSISASENLGVYLLYSPSEHGGFFCFEPVSHLVDAHNLKVVGGLVALRSGERFTGSIRLDWRWEAMEHWLTDKST